MECETPAPLFGVQQGVSPESSARAIWRLLEVGGDRFFWAGCDWGLALALASECLSCPGMRPSPLPIFNHGESR